MHAKVLYAVHDDVWLVAASAGRTSPRQLCMNLFATDCCRSAAGLKRRCLKEASAENGGFMTKMEQTISSTSFRNHLVFYGNIVIHLFLSSCCPLHGGVEQSCIQRMGKRLAG